MPRNNYERAIARYPDYANQWIDGDPSRFATSIESITLRGGETIQAGPGAVTVIVGPNNAGKSTLLNELRQVLGASHKQETLSNRSVESVQIRRQGSSADMLAWLGQNVPALPEHPNEWERFVNSWEPERGGVPAYGDLHSVFVFGASAREVLTRQLSSPIRNRLTELPNHPLHHLQDEPDLMSNVSSLHEKVFGDPLTLDQLGGTMQLRVGSLDEPSPRYGEVPESYIDAMEHLDPVDTQGDGMRAFLAQLLPVVTASHRVVLLDEPEAFLHPPQAHALGFHLGQHAIATDVQLILATHDKDLLSGLLASNVPVSVVRLTRHGNSLSAPQLSSDTLRELWSDPVFRHTNVLNALFHRVAVLAEGDGDCAFLRAALDDASRTHSLPPNEVLFVPTGGYAGMQKVAAALAAVKVPVVVAPDLDVLADATVLARIVDATAGAGSWDDECSTLLNAATSWIRNKSEPLSIGAVLETVNAAFATRQDEPFSSVSSRELRGLARASESPWNEVKEYGVSAFRGTALAKLNELLTKLDNLGVVLLRAGVLERLAPEVIARKGPGWIAEAIATGQQSNPATQAHVDRIMAAALIRGA